MGARIMIGIAAAVVLAAGVWTLAAQDGEEPDRKRARTADCGQYEVQPADDGPVGQAEQRCLVDAFERGERARLRVTRFTVEGDRLVDSYDVRGPGRLMWTSRPSGDRKVCDGVAVGQQLPDVARCRDR